MQILRPRVRWPWDEGTAKGSWHSRCFSAGRRQGRPEGWREGRPEGWREGSREGWREGWRQVQFGFNSCVVVRMPLRATFFMRVCRCGLRWRGAYAVAGCNVARNGLVVKLPAASCMLLRAAWGKAKDEHSVLDEKKLLQRRNLHEECYVWVFGVSVSEDWFSWQRWFCVFCSLGRVLLVLFCNIRVGVHYKKLITWPNQPKRLTGSKPFGDVGSSMVVEGDLWKPCTLGPLCVVCWQLARKFVFVISIVFGSMDEIGQTSIQTIYDM